MIKIKSVKVLEPGGFLGWVVRDGLTNEETLKLRLVYKRESAM